MPGGRRRERGRLVIGLSSVSTSEQQAAVGATGGARGNKGAAKGQQGSTGGNRYKKNTHHARMLKLKQYQLEKDT